MVDLGYFAPAMGSVLLIDQALKAVLLAALSEGRAITVGSLIEVRAVRSRGTLAKRAGAPSWLQALLLAGTFAVTLVATTQLPFLQTPAVLVAVGAAFGGAASNLIDLFARGGVVDYVDLRVWPVFNLADVAIVAGVVVAAASILGRVG